MCVAHVALYLLAARALKPAAGAARARRLPAAHRCYYLCSAACVGACMALLRAEDFAGAARWVHYAEWADTGVRAAAGRPIGVTHVLYRATAPLVHLLHAGDPRCRPLHYLACASRVAFCLSHGTGNRHRLLHLLVQAAALAAAHALCARLGLALARAWLHGVSLVFVLSVCVL